MRRKPPEPQPFAHVVRRAISWFITCAVIPSLVGAAAVTYLPERGDTFLNVDGTGGAMQITEDPDAPEIFLIPSEPEAPAPVESAPVQTAPAAPAPTAVPADPTPQPTPRLGLPPVGPPVGDVLDAVR